MIDRNKYTHHIKDESKIFKMRQLLDSVEMVIKNHTVEYSDFYDPYEVKLAISILNRFWEIDYLIFGGYKEAERKIIIIYPEYYYVGNIDYGLKVIEISGFSINLKHSDFLGAILNMGIERNKVGDIIVNEKKAYVVLKKEISKFILLSLKKIAKNYVTTRFVDFKDITIPELEYKEKINYMSSSRLDVYISLSYNLSRKDSKNLIDNKKVKVNWKQITDPSYSLKEKDIISIRGYGRSQIYKIKGKSRKNKIITIVRLLK